MGVVVVFIVFFLVDSVTDVDFRLPDQDFGQVNSASPPLVGLGPPLVQSGGISKRAAGMSSVLMVTVSIVNAAICVYCANGSGAADWPVPLPLAPPVLAASCESSAFFLWNRPPISWPTALPAWATLPSGLALDVSPSAD